MCHFVVILLHIFFRKTIRSFLPQFETHFGWLLTSFCCCCILIIKYTTFEFVQGIQCELIVFYGELYEFNWKCSCSLNVRNPQKSKIAFVSHEFSVLFHLILYVIKGRFLFEKISNFYAILVRNRIDRDGNDRSNSLVPCEWFQFNPINGPNSIDLCNAHLPQNSRITMRCINIFEN